MIPNVARFFQRMENQVALPATSEGKVRIGKVRQGPEQQCRAAIAIPITGPAALVRWFCKRTRTGLPFLVITGKQRSRIPEFTGGVNLIFYNRQDRIG